MHSHKMAASEAMPANNEARFSIGGKLPLQA